MDESLDIDQDDQSSGLTGIRKLPDELLLEIMRCSPPWGHAILLRVSRKFYELGIMDLYRTVRISTADAIVKFARTIRDDKNQRLALNVNCFDLMLKSSIFARPEAKDDVYQALASSLTNILLSITNITRLQIYAEGDSTSMLHNLSYDTHNFSKLKTLILTFHPLDGYANTFFRLLQRHPHLEALDISFHSGEYRRVPPHTFSDSLDLPYLRICRGPLKVLKHVLPAAPLLSAVSIDLSELSGFPLGMVENHLQPISQFTALREQTDSRRPLKFRLTLQAFDIVVTDATFRLLPVDIIYLSVQCNYANNVDRKLKELLDKGSLRRFTSLKHFALTPSSSKDLQDSDKNTLCLLAKRLQENCPSIDRITLGRSVYHTRRAAQPR
ncbi:hypothetical protein VKT23_009578 [Stygiomarasmius scandens]|uniref:F-box domain-containing protein n=1 Tax=Marasmiellus scandens TaxID=2682957 RepID=A0ABR1IZ21_9AGAR